MKYKISVIDCETDPFLHGRIPQPFIWGYYNGEEYLEFDRTEVLIANLKERREIIYAHNGGKFDFHYIVDKIDSTFIPITIINGRLVEIPLGKAKLRDSFAIIPIGLAQFEKMKFDYSKLEAHVRNKYMTEIREYLKSDCINLYNLVSDFVSRYGPSLTLATTAINEICRIQSIPKKTLQTNRTIYDTVHPYYYGGRVSCFEKGIFENTTYIYDINSAYPFVMCGNHPIGSSFNAFTTNQKIDSVNIQLGLTVKPTSFYGVIGHSKSAFPVRHKTGIEYPDAHGTFYVTGHELNAAIETDTFSGHLTNMIYFQNYISFRDYIKYYYQKKRLAVPKSTEYIFAKLLMNSAYGKMAANPDTYSDYMIIPRNFIKPASEIDGYEYHGTIGQNAIVSRPILEFKKRFYNLATAASITGAVRALLWSTIQSIRHTGYNIYYCDTDSIITDYPNLSTSDKLGDWKLEQTNDKLVIISPKLYGARNSKTGEWKIASKGVELDANELYTLARHCDVTYRRDAPTFSIANEPRFITRRLRW